MDNLKERIIYAVVTDIDSPTRVRVPGGRRRSEVHQIFKRIDSDECSSNTVADIIYNVAIDGDNDVRVESWDSFMIEHFFLA